MKSYQWWLIGIISLVIVACRIEGVNAAPLQYFGTPVFYGKFAPDQYTCTYNTEHRYGYCGALGLVEEGVVGFTDPKDPNKGVGYLMRLYGEIVCTNGNCTSNYGEPLGQIASSDTSYWYIPTGYYLANLGDKYVAFKHGHGPLAHDFPMKNVKVLPGYDDPATGVSEHFKDTRERYDVYCNASLECSYMGRVMLASQLIDYIPKVMTTSCSMLFCYHPDLTIAGLNPRVN